MDENEVDDEDYGSFDGRAGGGGIFGAQGVDYEMFDARARGLELRDDGTYVDHEAELRVGRARKRSRDEMFVVQRVIDEMPEFYAWLKQSARDRTLLAIARAVGMTNGSVETAVWVGAHEVMGRQDVTPTGVAIASDVVARVKSGVRDGTTDFIGRIVYRAYMRDQIERDRALNTLRGEEMEDAASRFAQRVASAIVGKILRIAGMSPEPSELEPEPEENA